VNQRLPLTLRINDEPVNTEAAFTDTLLTVLRDRLQLTAAKRGCNQGVCGACTVEIDGRPMRACLSLAHNCVESDVKTLEGLREETVVRALQDAFEQHGALQCGFCTPGMLVSAQALIAAQAAPGVEDVQRALSGNLCRCTGYKKITAAVLAAAQALRGER
jgi:aerobic-type carbon monoxide dehydrogenase small subunit (CoxS/CutS family)